MLKLETKLITFYFIALACALLWSVFELSNIMLPLFFAISFVFILIMPYNSRRIGELLLFLLFSADLYLLTYKSGSLGMAVGLLNAVPLMLALKNYRIFRASATR